MEVLSSCWSFQRQNNSDPRLYHFTEQWGAKQPVLEGPIRSQADCFYVLANSLSLHDSNHLPITAISLIKMEFPCSCVLLVDCFSWTPIELRLPLWRSAAVLFSSLHPLPLLLLLPPVSLFSYGSATLLVGRWSKGCKLPGEGLEIITACVQVLQRQTVKLMRNNCNCPVPPSPYFLREHTHHHHHVCTLRWIYSCVLDPLYLIKLQNYTL